MDADIITFDCYGTLIDWESGIAGAFQAEAAKDGKVLEREDVISAYMIQEPQVEALGFRPYREVLTETALLVAECLGWELSAARASFLAASLGEWQPFADTNAALEALAERYKLGILSNVDDDLLAATRSHFTVQFDLVVTAQQVKSYKPGFAHFQEGLRRAGEKRLVHAAQSYFHDVMPCSTLGIPVVWVNRKNKPIGPAGVQPTYMVSDLSGLRRLLLPNGPVS